jgi:hypothetical protein
MIRVYVAGKLSDKTAVEYIQNASRMTKVDLELRRMGFATFNPCLDLVTGLVSGDLKYDDYADPNMAWLEISDCVFLVPKWKGSKGTQAEIDRANELGIPVFDTYDDIERWSWDFVLNRDRKETESAVFVDYEMARGLLERLWKVFSSTGKQFDRTCVCGAAGAVTADSPFYKRLREDLFDFGVRGIAGFKYNEGVKK